MSWVRAIITFFVVIAAVNGLLVYLAISSDRGRIEENSYQLGLKYQKVIDAEQRARESHWKSEFQFRTPADGSHTDAVLIVSDEDGNRVEGRTFTISAKFASGPQAPISGTLRESNPGEYSASFPALSPGMWLTEIATHVDGEVLLWKRREVISGERR